MRISFGFVPFHSNDSGRCNGSGRCNDSGRCNGSGRSNGSGRCMQRPELIAITGQISPTKPQYPMD